jgi:glyoxylase-like metal-dependent hydrolase (beta-lactamase superfamily II)
VSAPLPSGVTVLERGWLSSNNIVLHDADSVTLIDTGYVDHAQQTLALVEQTRRGRPLATIVNTHLHSDHCGGNALLAERLHPRTLITPGEAQAVADWDEQALSFVATGQQCPRFGFDGLIGPGDVLSAGERQWQALGAAGHDAHMIMLFDEDSRTLISADALWADGFGALFGELDGGRCFDEQRAALDAIAACRPRVVIPGHGEPFADVQAALDRACARLEVLAADPQRNARHVLRVLLKFWLLQVRATSLHEAVAHFAPTRYFEVVRQRYFAHETIAQIIGRAAAELHRAGAASLDGDRLRNVD